MVDVSMSMSDMEVFMLNVRISMVYVNVKGLNFALS
jgi:hypothetical protein